MAERDVARPVSTLLWAQWQRTWGVVVGILPATALLAYLAALAQEAGLHEDYGEITAYGVLLAAIGTSMATVLLVHADSEKLAIALPLRILRLPVLTRRLVFGLMVYGVGVVAVVATGATLIVKTVNGLEFAWWFAPCFAVCITAMLQAWSYGLRDSDPRVAAVTLMGFMAPMLWVLTRDETFALMKRIHPVVALIAVPPVLYGIGVLTLGLNRRGGLPGLFPKIMPTREAKPFTATSLRPFSSPLKTQLWYEWRQFGWQLPAFLFVALALYFLAMPMAIALFGGTGVNVGMSADTPPASLAVDYLKHVEFVTTGLLFAAVVASVLVGAMMFMKGGYWNARSTYLMTLPISTRRLAHARISMAFKSVIAGLVVLAGMLGLASLAMIASGEESRLVHYLSQGYRIDDVFTGEVSGATPAQVIGFYLGVLFVTMWVALWALNAGWSLLIYGVVVGIPVGVMWALESSGSFSGGEEADSIRNVCFWVASSLLIGTVVVIALSCLRSRLTSIGSMLFALAFLAVCVVTFVLFDDAYIEQPGANLVGGQRWPHPANWSMWVGLAALPVAPFFVHPFLVARARNR